VAINTQGFQRAQDWNL